MKNDTIKPIPPTKKEVMDSVKEMLQCCIETNNTVYAMYTIDHVNCSMFFIDQRQFIELVEISGYTKDGILEINSNTNKVDILFFLNQYFNELRQKGYKTR